MHLERRRTLRHLLDALARSHAEYPDRPLSIAELQAAGWPNEKMAAESGAHRVYTALWTLRKLGLRDFIVRRGDGYCLIGHVEPSPDR